MTETCDKLIWTGKRCGRKKFMEVYWSTVGKKGIRVISLRHYSYLCRYHYYLDRIKNWVFHWENWYCDIDEEDDE